VIEEMVRTNRRGFTLVELVVSMLGASVLMCGLGSSMFIALKATDTSSTPSWAVLQGNAQLDDIAADLKYAQTITEQTATAVTVTAPDRNTDSNPETIRYAWSGTPGDPLTREYNGGTASNAMEDVYAFDILYYQPATSVEYLTIELQVSSDSRANVQTAIPLLNRP
jgi:Tfp pilus assembly protein PilW